jgi:hypothetical protein
MDNKNYIFSWMHIFLLLTASQIAALAKTESATQMSALEKFFSQSTIKGQFKAMYAGYDYKSSDEKDTYATAIGGTLKYITPTLYHLSAAAAVATSQDIDYLTGDRHTGNQNGELSSSKGKYTLLSQAYVNYKAKGIRLRAGRQHIDTPLADSDPIRMNPNTFEAYMLTYHMHHFTFTAGNLQRWQGYDAGLDNGFVTVGKNGAWLAGGTYEHKHIGASLWYYNISGMTDAIYGETEFSQKISQGVRATLGLQYLNENELQHSNISADIFGVSARLKIQHLRLGIAYDRAVVARGKESFSGFGGGTLFTSMDTTILDNIAQDRNAYAIVPNIGYNFNKISLYYAYGAFLADENSAGEKSHIIEQNVKLTFRPYEHWRLSALFVTYDNLNNTSDPSWKRLQFLIAYKF